MALMACLDCKLQHILSSNKQTQSKTPSCSRPRKPPLLFAASCAQVEICAGKAHLSKGLRLAGYSGKEYDVPWFIEGVWILENMTAFYRNIEFYAML